MCPRSHSGIFLNNWEIDEGVFQRITSGGFQFFDPFLGFTQHSVGLGQLVEKLILECDDLMLGVFQRDLGFVQLPLQVFYPGFELMNFFRQALLFLQVGAS